MKFTTAFTSVVLAAGSLVTAAPKGAGESTADSVNVVDITVANTTVTDARSINVQYCDAPGIFGHCERVSSAKTGSCFELDQLFGNAVVSFVAYGATRCTFWSREDCLGGGVVTVAGSGNPSQVYIDNFKTSNPGAVITSFTCY